MLVRKDRETGGRRESRGRTLKRIRFLSHPSTFSSFHWAGPGSVRGYIEFLFTGEFPGKQYWTVYSQLTDGGGSLLIKCLAFHRSFENSIRVAKKDELTSRGNVAAATIVWSFSLEYLFETYLLKKARKTVIIIFKSRKRNIFWEWDFFSRKYMIS